MKMHQNLLYQSNLMKIELIIDDYCLSLNIYMDMIKKVAQEFPECEIKITSFETEHKRLKSLKINLLPAWLIDNEVLRFNPGNYELLRKIIISKRVQPHDTQFE